MGTRTTSIAALLTCHNRKQSTLACLEALHRCALPAGYALDVYLVDDGSTDGTASAALDRFPAVRIIRGAGDLFWNRGMHTAFASAMQDGHSFYLWLNDDTFLDIGALKRLMFTYERVASVGQPYSIVVGSTRDARTGELTYGGVVRRSWWHPLRLRVIEPSSVPLRCDTFFGNCVLLPDRVARRVGNLDPVFTHSGGDTDYGFRARKKGCSIWVASGFLGTCARNPVDGTWEDPTLALRQRWNKVREPKGLPPAEWVVILRRQAPVLWPFYLVLPYARLVAGSVLSGFRRRWGGRSG